MRCASRPNHRRQGPGVLTTSHAQKTVTVAEEDLAAGDTVGLVIRVRGTHADVAYAKGFVSATEL